MLQVPGCCRLPGLNSRNVLPQLYMHVWSDSSSDICSDHVAGSTCRTCTPPGGTTPNSCKLMCDVDASMPVYLAFGGSSCLLVVSHMRSTEQQARSRKVLICAVQTSAEHVSAVTRTQNMHACDNSGLRHSVDSPGMRHQQVILTRPLS